MNKTIKSCNLTTTRIITSFIITQNVNTLLYSTLVMTRYQEVLFCIRAILHHQSHAGIQLFSGAKMYTQKTITNYTCLVLLCDKVCQWHATGRLFSLGTPESSANKIDRHDIAEILLKVALSIINHKHVKFMMIHIIIYIKYKCKSTSYSL
jgi:hypothetical protein